MGTVFCLNAQTPVVQISTWFASRAQKNSFRSFQALVYHRLIVYYLHENDSTASLHGSMCGRPTAFHRRPADRAQSVMTHVRLGVFVYTGRQSSLTSIIKKKKPSASALVGSSGSRVRATVVAGRGTKTVGTSCSVASLFHPGPCPVTDNVFVFSLFDTNLVGSRLVSCSVVLLCCFVRRPNNAAVHVIV